MRVLLIAESPPDPGSGQRRFFYSPTLAIDNLYRGVAEAVYGESAQLDLRDKPAPEHGVIICHDLPSIEVVAARVTGEMQVFGRPEVLAHSSRRCCSRRCARWERPSPRSFVETP